MGVGGGERWGGGGVLGKNERENSNSNSKTILPGRKLFDKDCSLGSVKNLTTGPC